jgi:hypothetical protein
MTQRIVTRAQAVANNSRFYFTGSLCPAGHKAKRRTSSGSCTACELSRSRRYYQQRKDALNAKCGTQAAEAGSRV